MYESAAQASVESEGLGEGLEKFLMFFLGDEEYGIEILQVREIIGLVPVTPVPRAPRYVRGVINLRGEVIPVVDVRVRFEMDQVSDTDQTCIIVVQSRDVHLGIVVDKVSEVLDIPGEEIIDPSSLGGEIRIEYLLGIGRLGDRVTLLLDLDRVFGDQELDALVQAA